MKKIFITIVLIIIAISFTIAYIKFDKNEKVISAYDEIFKIQADVDKEIENFINNEEYTLENPKVLLNPYKISPLTALIIFQTEEKNSVEVNINDSFTTTIESNKKHAIPIYGMYADYENKITLKLSNGKEKELTIKTETYKGEKINLEKTSKQVENNLYFLSPNFVNNCIIDGKGNVVWYLLGDYAGDIEYLDNGHFYISDPNQGKNGVKINYSSFIEMDYLGKIYKQWIVEFGVHHELVPLSNNKMIVLGTNDESRFVDAEICIIDLKTGETTKHIDLYKLLHDIDADLIEGLGEKFDLVNNSVDFNEKTKELLISLRGVNSLMSLNLESRKINWIFGNPDFWGENFSKYMLKVTDDTRFLGGQHTAFFIKDNFIGVHNNDIDQFDLSSPNLSHYTERYTSCDFYEVDAENMTIKTVWQYTANKELFSNVGGHIEILENGNKLITYGWAMTEEAYDNPEEILYTDPAYKNGVVVEIDQNENVVFKASMAGLVYRTFKVDSLYENKVKGYEVKDFKRINGTIESEKKVNTDTIKTLLDTTKKYENKIEIITNRVSINDELEKEDIVDIIFVGENEYSYICSYKEAGKEAPKSFNSGYASKMMNIASGRYKVYIKINDEYYESDIIIEF